MDTTNNGPITASRHHKNDANDIKINEERIKPNTNKFILIIAVILFFLMGLGAFFFVVTSDQAEGELIDIMEKAEALQ